MNLSVSLLQIETVVESPSEVHTALIASLSVFFGVVVMIFLFVVLYKVSVQYAVVSNQ